MGIYCPPASTAKNCGWTNKQLFLRGIILKGWWKISWFPNCEKGFLSQIGHRWAPLSCKRLNGFNSSVIQIVYFWRVFHFKWGIRVRLLKVVRGVIVLNFNKVLLLGKKKKKKTIKKLNKKKISTISYILRSFPIQAHKTMTKSHGFRFGYSYFGKMLQTCKQMHIRHMTWLEIWPRFHCQKCEKNI